MNPYPQTIVCPIFCEGCLDATLRYAAFLAKWSGARLLVVTMNDGPRSHDEPGEPGASVRRLDSRDDEDHPDNDHFPELQDVVYERYELVGEPISGLHDFVERVEADLVVIGNDIGIEHTATLGRVTQSIANCVACNVVLVKQSDDEATNRAFWGPANQMVT